MKRKLLSFAVLITLLLVPTVNRAQSIKDLFNKDNISKVVNAVTGHTETGPGVIPARPLSSSLKTC